ncbi:MAG TPA: MFS transporter [Candidatus Aquilonibacter sp.]
MRFSERLAVLVAALSFFISTLDTGVVNVALPELARALHVSAALVAWTIGAYALALSLAILPFGALGDRLGVVRISACGFVLFALFSFGCAFAPNLAWLLVFRALTGVAAAMLQATASSFVTRYVEQARRGSAFGWVSAVLSLGVVLGPSVGGVIVSFASWRWIFIAAVPFGIVGLVANLLIHDARGLPAERVQSSGTSLHGVGVLPFIGAIALGATFIAVFIGTPFELTRQAHLAAWQVGLVLFATPIGASVAARVAGPFVQRGLGVTLMIAGLALDGAVAVALFFTPATNVALFALLLLIFGIGSGTLQTPVIALSLAAFPPSAQSRAGAMQRFVQNLAISGGAALCGLLIDRTGAWSVWVFTVGVSVAAVVALALIATRAARRAPQLQASRTR